MRQAYRSCSPRRQERPTRPSLPAPDPTVCSQEEIARLRPPQSPHIVRGGRLELDPLLAIEVRKAELASHEHVVLTRYPESHRVHADGVEIDNGPGRPIPVLKRVCGHPHLT